MIFASILALNARADAAPSEAFTPSTEYLSTTATSLTACITLMIALSYLVGLSWAFKYAQANPKPLNKGSGVHLQKYAPLAYVFLVLLSLSEVALSSWLIFQWRFHHNYPNVGVRTSARFLLFSACWTAVTAAAYSILFVHPRWSKHPVSSVGAQSLWIIVTWVFWIVGAGLLNSAAARVLVKGACGEVVYCGQIRALFGVAVIQSLTLTAGMATIMWLAWQSAREAYALNSRPFSVVARASRMFTSS